MRLLAIEREKQKMMKKIASIEAKKNSKITNQIIDVASKNGKLKELTTLSVI